MIQSILRLTEKIYKTWPKKLRTPMPDMVNKYFNLVRSFHSIYLSCTRAEERYRVRDRREYPFLLPGNVSRLVPTKAPLSWYQGWWTLTRIWRDFRKYYNYLSTQNGYIKYSIRYSSRYSIFVKLSIQLKPSSIEREGSSVVVRVLKDNFIVLSGLKIASKCIGIKKINIISNK